MPKNRKSLEKLRKCKLRVENLAPKWGSFAALV